MPRKKWYPINFNIEIIISVFNKKITSFSLLYKENLMREKEDTYSFKKNMLGRC